MQTPNAPPDALVARFRDELTALVGPLLQAARLGVAVSGGPDSLALLLLANAALPDQVVAATVDHGLRAEAAGEARMVGQICEAMGVPHEILTLSGQIAPGGNIQERARIARYGALATWGCARETGAIATAHHRDDVAETFLMRAVRGAGAGGLARMAAIGAMPYSGESPVTLVRPLLDWRREDLAEIVRAAGLTAIDDPSNRNLRHDRARIRALLAREPLLDPEQLAHAAANLADAESALVWVTDQAWKSRVHNQKETEIRLDMDNLPAEIRRRLASRAIRTLSPAWNGEGMDRLIVRLEAGAAATLAGVKVSGGSVWRFSLAPARRDHC